MNVQLPSALHPDRRILSSRVCRLGFTLVELLLVIAIIGTLAGMALPRMADMRTQGEYTTAIGDVRRLESEVLAYLAANRQLPPDLGTLNLDLLKDPWGRPYVYLPHYTTPPTSASGLLNKPTGARTDQFLKPLNNDFDLFSQGPDGDSQAPLNAKASQDDVIRAVGGAFIGKAEDF